VVGTVELAEAVSGHAAHAETHSDQPKHSFGSCSVCARRLQAHHDEAPAVRRRRREATLPTSFLVQTSVVSDEGRR
jgi:hypothetical protein